MSTEKKSALAGAAIFAALVIWELFFLRPGLGAPEELANLALIETLADGWRWWLRLGGGALSRGLQALFTAGPWPWQSIYLYNALAIGLLAWGLWRWAERLGGEKAALLTLALAFSAPFSYLQARTTFAYVIQPGLLLALAWARPTFGLGLLAGLLALDYEAWPLGLLALGLVWAPRRALPGMALGLLIVYGLNLPYAHGWAAQRSGWAWGWGANLQSFFFGGSHPKAMGLESWPAFPILAWPGLLLAFKARPPRWLWLWAGIGLLGLIPAGPVQEPNRAIYAWPALLLLSGLGWSWALKESRAWGLSLAVILAPLLGWAQFNRAIRVWDEAIHGLSRRLMDAASGLRPEGRLRLDNRDSVVLARFSGQGSSPWVLVPPGLVDAQDPAWGLWRGFGKDGAPTTWLLSPSDIALGPLRSAAASPALQPAFSALPDGEKLRRLRLQALSPRNALQASLEESQRVQLALRLGALQPDDLGFSLGPSNLLRDPLDQLAGAFAGNPIGEAASKARDALQRPGERWRRLTRP